VASAWDWRSCGGCATFSRTPWRCVPGPDGARWFRVVVPAATSATRTQPALEAETLPPRTDVRVPVLLIDDERAIRDATRELLRPLQVDVLVAATIAEAVEQARQATARIDMILSDWRLRGTETGVEAVRAVRRICGEGNARGAGDGRYVGRRADDGARKRAGHPAQTVAAA